VALVEAATVAVAVAVAVALGVAVAVASDYGCKWLVWLTGRLAPRL